MIVLIILQRVISKAHTFNQVIIGFLLGVFYSFIYISLNVSLSSFLVVVSIGIMLLLLILYNE
jgi:membrane-associated phospholipid phosphatase